MTTLYFMPAQTGVTYYFEEYSNGNVLAGAVRQDGGVAAYKGRMYKSETAFMDAYRDMNDHYVFEKSHMAASYLLPLGLPPLEDWVKEDR